MQPTRITLRLSTGRHVTLTAWSEEAFETHAADLLAFVTEFGQLLAEGQAPESVAEGQATLLRSVIHSAIQGPRPKLLMRDLMPLAYAIWQLNDLEGWLSPLMALASTALRANARAKLNRAGPN